jgi:hypothetical protein
LKPERHARQNTDSRGDNRACSRHVCGLGRAYLFVVSDLRGSIELWIWLTISSWYHCKIYKLSMNRRKKIKQLLKAHAKKASAKLAPPSKDKYISKADRLKLAAEESSPDSIGSAES